MNNKLIQLTISEMVINGQKVPLNVTISVPMTLEPQSYPVPPGKYALLAEYVATHGGLPGSSFPESAILLSNEMGWIVEPDALRVAWYRKNKQKKSLSYR